MSKYKIPAIVFGGGMNGLGVVRNLGRNGISVYCVLGEKDPVIHSKFCKKHYVVPHIQESKIILKKFLAKMERNLNDYAVLFSTSDSYSLHLSELKDELEGSYYMPLASYEVVRTLVDKKEFYRSLRKYSVLHPNTFFPESPKDVKRIGKKIGYPVFVKPSISETFWRRFHKKGFLANSERDLMKYYLLTEKYDIDVLFQEVIPGLAAKNIFGIEAYFNESHDPKAFFAYCRLRGWPPVFGNTCLRESISMSEITIPYMATESYLHHIGYHGLMEAEWKKDSRDNTFKLLEINARQSMQNSLPAACGINLVLVAYLDVIGEKVGQLYEYRKGIRWIDFLNDLRSVIKTNTPIKDWIISLKGVREWSFLAKDDLKPWIISCFDTLNRITRGVSGLAEM